jgi:hypothetical protein
MLLFARAVAAADTNLHPDLPGPVNQEYGGADPLLTSLCQFDLLVTVIAGIEAGASTKQELFQVSYPNFAEAEGRRANDIVRPLIFDTSMRSALVPEASDEQLAQALHLADQAAQDATKRFWSWEGYTDPDVRRFIEKALGDH